MNFLNTCKQYDKHIVNKSAEVKDQTGRKKQIFHFILFHEHSFDSNNFFQKDLIKFMLTTT